MSVGGVGYNERSWAIDLIGHIKHLVATTNRSIKDAGGEQTIKADGGGSLFPDVLLFGDRATARILQGWELKMPDTSIDDYAFRHNAEAKARALGLDSYLLWNVSTARLYARDADDKTFRLVKEWGELADVTTRTAVLGHRKRWEDLAVRIVSYLNDLFDRGSLEGRPFVEAYKSGGVTSLIMENVGGVAEALATASASNLTLRSEMTVWWDRYKLEYGAGTMTSVLAQAVITNWIGKILFANILREQDHRAQKIRDLGDATTPQEALGLFRQLSEECNFWTIFSNSIGLAALPPRAWRQLKEFNRLLSDLRVGSIDQAQLSGILEATVEVAVRKLRGQYPTPIQLARLLVNLCVKDATQDRVLDPCCGSGTIARAALEQKLAAGVKPEVATASIFAGDQDPQAVHVATFALAKPALMHMPLRLFQRDAFTLEPQTKLEFRDPTNGSVFYEQMGQFNAITSNFPFVAQQGRKRYGDVIRDVSANLTQAGHRFSGRADISAYLPFCLHPMLADHGRLGIIITNAWLGTDWGDAFYAALCRYYDLKSIITSGAGRWFQNSEVVTNVLILEKKADPDTPSGDVQFVVLKHRLEELVDGDAIQSVVAQIELGQTLNESMTIRSVSPVRLAKFREFGLGGNAQFVHCDWILALPLVPLKSLFKIRRGERRGLNAMFYPIGEHGIETEYIRPLVKSPTAFERLKTCARRDAFSCSRSEEELRQLGHVGALAWIEHFKTPANIKKLEKKGLYWYQMDAERLTDLVMFINYGERLFVGRVDPPAFVDQRMVCLEPTDESVDIELCHALMNSAIGLFMIEGLGFGRGLGALDLSKDRIEDYMHILDPGFLSQQRIDDIKAKFRPLVERNIMAVADELEQQDRKDFDDVVIGAFDLDISREQIYDSLRALVDIRIAAQD